MFERDWREWQEYDARLIEDSPLAPVSRPAAEQFAATGESDAPGESPFLLESPSEAEDEAEDLMWRSRRVGMARRGTVRHSPSSHGSLNHRRHSIAAPGSGCNCACPEGDDSSGDGNTDQTQSIEELESESFFGTPSRVAPEREDVNDLSLEPYRIEGGKYSPKEKQLAAQDRAGLILTASIVGKEEQKLSVRGPTPISVSKEMMRFEAGKLGDFVSNWNDFTVYLSEVLNSIGRLRDLLSAGAPEVPTAMTAAQKRALRPTDDTSRTAGIKGAYRTWRRTQAKYATIGADGFVSGLVFDVAETQRAVEAARQAFWEAKGRLSRTIAAAKTLDKPKYQGLELKLSDLMAVLGGLTDPIGAITWAVPKIIEARKARSEYDAKMIEFAAAVQQANDHVKDDFESFKNAMNAFWDKQAAYGRASQELNKTRIDSREDAAILGQSTAGRSTSEGNVLAEVRMPELVADAWHALASIGPSARKKLLVTLSGRTVVESASAKYDRWWNDPYESNDITVIRHAWQKALSWEPILTKDDVDRWVRTNKMWDDILEQFNV